MRKTRKLTTIKNQASDLPLEGQRRYHVKEERQKGLLGCWHYSIYGIGFGSTYVRIHFVVVCYTDIYDSCIFL